MVTEKYDYIVIGAGGSGLASAMYAARLGLKSLCLGFSHMAELPVGGVITTTHLVENYPGFKSISGPDLAQKIEEHAREYDLVTIKEEKANTAEKTAKGFTVKTDKGTYTSKAIMIATGTKWKKLPESVPGAKEFEHKGIAYCALCDAPLFRNKITCIVGGSDSAAKDALVLAEHAKKVYIIARSTLHPEPINAQRVKDAKNIEVIEGTEIAAIKGEQLVSSIELTKPYKGKKEMEMQGVFVAIGHEVLTELAATLGVKRNRKKEIVTDKEARTNVEGVFAAGDCADTPFKQLITGVAEGCIGAHSAYEYINQKRVQAT